MIAENVQNVLKEIAGGNAFGEKITLVAATKTRTPEEINEAIAAGVTDIGENKVQGVPRQVRPRCTAQTGTSSDICRPTR